MLEFLLDLTHLNVAIVVDVAIVEELVRRHVLLFHYIPNEFKGVVRLFFLSR